MREISKQIVGDNLKGELAPFSFMLPSGGKYIGNQRSSSNIYSRAGCKGCPPLR